MNTLNFDIVTPNNVIEFKSKTKQVTFDTGHTVDLDIGKSHPFIHALNHNDFSAANTLAKKSKLFVVDNDNVVDCVIPANPNKEVFVHSNKIINEMLRHLGISTKMEMVKKVDTMSFNLDKKDETAFDIDLKFKWSPFQESVYSFTELMRVVCSNMATVNDQMFGYTIPLINQWDENIDVATQAVRHNIESQLIPMMKTMLDTKASLFDIITLNNMTAERNIKDFDTVSSKSQQFVRSINNMCANLIDKVGGIRNVRNVASQLIDTPIKSYDLYNLTTELASHHIQQSYDKLSALSNSIMFASAKKDRKQKLGGLVIDNNEFDSMNQAFALAA